jgi:hypothetical protein
MQHEIIDTTNNRYQLIKELDRLKEENAILKSHIKLMRRTGSSQTNDRDSTSGAQPQMEKKTAIIPKILESKQSSTILACLPDHQEKINTLKEMSQGKYII